MSAMLQSAAACVAKETFVGRQRQRRGAACRASASAPRHAAHVAMAVATKQLKYEALGGNGWIARLPGAAQTILVDPWLVGDLTFGSEALRFLYTGTRPDVPNDNLAAAEEASVILLTQGLDDHTHRPTLERLSKDIPIVASPSAAKIAQELGFELVFPLAHNETVTLDNIRFRATAGGLVGPPWSTRENGFVIEDMTNHLSVYYEPHVDFVDESVVSAATEVDVIVSPVTNVTFGGYPIVCGTPRNVERLLKLLKPQVLIPLRNDLTRNQGAISALIREEVGLDEVRRWLNGPQATRGAKGTRPTRIVEAPLGQPLDLELQ